MVFKADVFHLNKCSMRAYNIEARDICHYLNDLKKKKT